MVNVYDSSLANQLSRIGSRLAFSCIY